MEEQKFAGDNREFLLSEEVLGKAPTFEEILPLWKNIMDGAEDLDDAVVCDEPFSNGKTNGLIAISNGLFKYHFYVRPNKDNTEIIIRLENWDDDYVDKKRAFISSLGFNTNGQDRRNAATQNEYRTVFETKISKENYLELYNITKEFRKELTGELVQSFSFKSVKEVLPHPIRFGRWLLKYAEPTWDGDGLSCWFYDGSPRNTDELFEIFMSGENGTC